MKVNIMDPALVVKGGHYFDWDLRIAQTLKKMGHEVHVYAHKTIKPDVTDSLSQSGGVTGLFSAHPHVNTTALDPIAGEMVNYCDQTRVLANDLKSVGVADLWLWPTFFAQQLNACAELGWHTPVVGCVHQDPGIAQKSVGSMLWRHAMLEVKKKALPYIVGTNERELLHRFMHVVPGNGFPLIPYPCDGFPVSEPKKSLRRIGIFGAHRAEKGVNILDRLVIELLTGGFEVVLHDSKGVLNVENRDGLKYLTFAENLAVEIADCDLVVLPYSINAYQGHGSGILAECLACGIPVVGPVGTLPGRTIAEFGAGVLFAEFSVQAILAAVKLANASYVKYANAAYAASRIWANVNGTGHYVNSVLRIAKTMRQASPM